MIMGAVEVEKWIQIYFGDEHQPGFITTRGRGGMGYEF
jgi:hypothetical protein